MRQSDFRVVARGVHKQTSDISQLMRTSLNFYLASKEKEAQSSTDGVGQSGEPDEAA